MISRLLYIIVFLFFVLITGCTRIKTLEDFNRWLNEPSNGCVASQSIAGAKVTVKFLPGAYSALKDYGNDSAISQRKFENLRQSYDSSLTFLMALGPDTQKLAASVMYEGVSNYSDFSSRVMSTNFFMDQHVKLYVDGKQYRPAIAIMENVYELSDKRNFMIVFKAGQQLYKGREYLFVYDDPFFQMGKVQLSFDGEKILQARALKVVL